MRIINGFRKQKSDYQEQIDLLQKDVKTISDNELATLDKKFSEMEDFENCDSYMGTLHPIVEKEMESRNLQTESELRENVWFSQRGRI